MTARFAWPGNVSWSLASRSEGAVRPSHASSSQRAPTSVSARPWILPAASKRARHVRTPRKSPLWLNEKRPAGSSNGWVSASPSVESFEGRRRWTSAAVVSTAPIVSRSGSSPNARVSRCDSIRPVRREPRRAPAESGDPEPLEPLRERPELVEPERLVGPGDVVLAHRAGSYAALVCRLAVGLRERFVGQRRHVGRGRRPWSDL